MKVLHRNIDKAVSKRFMESPSNEYKFRGDNYTITPDNFAELPRELQQSFATWCKKQNPPPPQPIQGPQPSPDKGRKTRTGPIKEVKETKNERLVRETLLRLATTEMPVEEKLNYPKVFQDLLSQPHMALSNFKVTMEDNINLTLFVDTNVGYHEQDQELHSTIIKMALKIKGIDVFYGSQLNVYYHNGKQLSNGLYYSQYLHKLKPHQRKNIWVFGQGCGSKSVEMYKGIERFKVNFATCFTDNDSYCGCNQIHLAKAQKSIKMNWNIDTYEKFSKLNK